MKTAILVVSIVANVALATYLVSEDVGQPETRTAAEHRPSPDASSSVAFFSDGEMDAAALRRHLVQLGLADRETKPIVLAYLNAAAFSRDLSAPYEYWRAEDGSNAVSRVEATEKNSEQIRATLLALYGAAAQDDPAFATAFRPLQDRFPFLSSQQQIAVRRLQSERRAAGTQTIAAAGPAGSSVPPGRPAAPPQDAQIRDILRDEATYREYAMRESALAYRLRSAGVAFTESEYRAVFELMHEYGASANPAAFVAQRDAVRNVLGRERALQLWAATDPLFQSIEQVSQQHGLRESAVLDAYEAVVAAQDDLLRMSGGPPDARQAQFIRERIERRDSMLRSLVGDAAARGLIEAIGARFGGSRVMPSAPPFPR
jgi:hypothetical protein